MQNPPKVDRKVLTILIAVAALTTLALMIPQVRQSFRDLVLSNSRQVLAKAEGDLTGHGDLVSVIKVKEKNELKIEVYGVNPEKNETTLRSRLILPENRDGYFQFRGQPTNLVLVDLNGDGILEIAAPTFDENLIPRLHIYRYDPAAQVFILTGPEFLQNAPPSLPQ